MTKRFGYLRVELTNDWSLDKLLREYGKEGWQLVHVVHSHTCQPEYIFMRELLEDKP